MSKRMFLLVLSVSLVVTVITLTAEQRFSNYEGFSMPRVEQARIPFIYDVCNSAPPSNSTVWFNVDILDTLGGQPVQSTVTLWYSFDSQSSWNSSSMVPIDTVGYKITYETDIVVPGSGTIYYYIRAQNSDGYYGTQSPINVGNVFPTPANLLVSTCDEIAGDTTGGAAGPWLDLTGCWAGYSQDYLYIKISNNGGGWPWYENFLFGPWYLYGGGVYNPESPSDTFAYMLMRVDNPLLTSCLLKINQYTGDYWDIGNIDETTNADSLWLRCSFADLVNDPDFGPWPNTSGLYLSSGTSTFYISGDLELNDYAEPGRFYRETPTFIVDSNTPPVLTNPQVVPDSGTPDTTFTFAVTYTDSDNNLPTLKDVVIDGTDYQMSSDDHSYSDGADFYFSMDSFSVGEHYFYFEFSDGMDTINTNIDTFVVFEIGIEEEEDKERLIGIFQNSPNPFTTSTTITFILPGAEGIGQSVKGKEQRAEGIELNIYDLSGRLVRSFTLPTAYSLLPTEIIWDGRDDSGNKVGNGIYLLRLETQNFRMIKKMVFIGR
ncbi:MAG: hypothetical protein E3J87_11080 [Candidatus Cloacimonadota bacterium]|nr:MAG: hypothetical protein E3J87_11080 [Candidatus Cloacimonadota bacterium]